MKHRHLNHSRYTLAAIDSLITRGEKADWMELMEAAKNDAALLGKIQRVCLANAGADFDADLYEFWRQWLAQQGAA